MIVGEDFIIRPILSDKAEDLAAVLRVYLACEDFLSLGPVAYASPEMVMADLELSRREGGLFCGIHAAADGLEPGGSMVGLIDYVAAGWEGDPGLAFLSLLMIIPQQRGRGLGGQVVQALEAAIRAEGVHFIESAVQVNHPQGIRFWQGQGYKIISKPEPQPDGTITYRLRKEI
jgi:ribosomal protein S18 acetylase RimI-like enzyme